MYKRQPHVAPPSQAHLTALFQEYRDLHQDEQEEDIFTPSESENEPLISIEELAKKWLNIELSHHVSKTASNEFWKVALQIIPKLVPMKKTPTFPTLRKKMYGSLIPPINLHIAYENKATGEVQYVDQESTPISAFPVSDYTKLFEVATVKVIKICGIT